MTFTASDALNAIRQKDHVALENIVGSILNDKMSVALAARKQEVAKAYFNPVATEEVEVPLKDVEKSKEDEKLDKEGKDGHSEGEDKDKPADKKLQKKLEKDLTKEIEG